MENLNVTKEAVLRASEKCLTAKSILKELFPNVFEDETEYNGGAIFADGDKYLYILAQVNPYEYNLITIWGGNRLKHPINLEKHNFTIQELEKHFGTYKFTFKGYANKLINLTPMAENNSSKEEAK